MSSAPKILIRPAGLADLQDVLRIEHASFDDPWSDTSLAGELLTDLLRLPLVAEFEGRVIAFLMAWKVADQLHILNIAVEPSLRRSGIATMLLQAAAGEGARHGLNEITLEVRRSNQPAIRFYERHGFIEVGVREGYYADNGEDALIMNCPLRHLLPSEDQ